MTNFNVKKEKLVSLIESYIADSSKANELQYFVRELKMDVDFKGKDLFASIFHEFENHLKELTQRELKQRVLLIRSFD